MSTYILVHGAWHGAWCWEDLIPELEALGHRAVAVDLPSDRADADLEDYIAAVVDVLPPGDTDVVLVGHSLGGLLTPIVASRHPIRHLVYLCALVPQGGRSLSDQLGDGETPLGPGFGDHLIGHDDGSSEWPVEPAIAAFYDDCDGPAARRAAERLRRQYWPLANDPFPYLALPNVPSTYVLGAEDRVVQPDWSRAVARERLHLDPVELPGGHSPFLSRPKDLAVVLADV